MSPGGLRSGLVKLLAIACLLPLLSAGCTMAVHSAVRDQSGKPVQDAVVYATPREKRRLPPGGGHTAVIVLEDFAFRPPVLPVRVGTGVSFLNRDDLRHQIYSISAAKNFELLADRLSTSGEVVFDRPGAVVLGCAAHDRMIGHVYVLETPYFATTGADGRAELAGLPRGAYDVRVWHPDLKPSARVASHRVADTRSHRVGVDFTLSVQRARPPE